MFIKPAPKQPLHLRAAVRMKGMKFSSSLLVGLFFMLLVAPANHQSSAMDQEARIIFEVG